MNTSPMLHGKPVNYQGCGRLGAENTALAFWQSRMTVTAGRAEVPALVDLAALARAIRSEVPRAE